MNAEELLSDNKELAHKRRSVSDLIRHIATTTGGAANYSVLLGAGCSVTSGIKPATELIKSWAIELHERFSGERTGDFEVAQAYLVKNHGSWYNPLNPYASLFEKKYDFPLQRRRFVEREVDGKHPSIGYAYLSALATENFLSTIFTTNFDDLINESFYQYSNVRPQHCAQDSSISSISVTSKRPKIVKLHGDYFFDDIKSTLKETESLEHNTKEKLIEFCKEYGLIVVGYSGNDRSIMDVLEYLTKQDNYLKNGVYWCMRKGDEVSHTLRNLLWRDKVYPVLIDGFDEFFAETYTNIIKKPLDLKSNAKESKLKESIKYIVDDNYNLKKNPVIANEIDFIKRNENSNDISQFINDLSKDSEVEGEVGLADMRNLLEVDSEMEKGKLREALLLCEGYFSLIASTDEDRTTPYLRKLIKISKYLDETEKAQRWCEKLIAVDKNNLSSYLLKATCIDSLSEKYEFLKDTSKKFPNKYMVYNALSAASENLLSNSPRCQSTSLADRIKYIEKSIKLEPSLDNLAWLDLYGALQLQRKPTNKSDVNKEISEKMERVLRDSNLCNPHHLTTLKLDVKASMTKNDASLILKSIKNLHEVYEEASKKEKLSIILLLIKVLKDPDGFEGKEDYRSAAHKLYEQTIKDKYIKKHSKILIAKSLYYIEHKEDVQVAEDYFQEALECKDVVNNLMELIEVASIIGVGSLDKLQSIVDKEKYMLAIPYFYKIKAAIAEAKGEYDIATVFLEKAFHAGLSLDAYLSSKTYILTLERKYEDILDLMSQYEWTFDLQDYETAVINYNFAAKEIGSEKFDRTKLLNLSAQSQSNNVRLCAFVLCDDIISAKRIASKSAEKSHLSYIRYSKWPILQGDFIHNINVMGKTA
jgi:NAD-dependent SIR2 family protein deacetylase